jgi:hypothetical protein
METGPVSETFLQLFGISDKKLHNPSDSECYIPFRIKFHALRKTEVIKRKCSGI